MRDQNGLPNEKFGFLKRELSWDELRLVSGGNNEGGGGGGGAAEGGGCVGEDCR